MTEWNGLTIPTLEGFTGFAPPEGTGSYGVALIGEALGEHEARFSQPFYPMAPAGSTLNRLLKRAGLERDNFVTSNAVWSRPPNNRLEHTPYEGEAIASFAPFRDKLFEQYRPRVFVALGNVALKALTPYGAGKTTISHVQGYVLEGPYSGTYVVGTFHPSAIMQGLQGLSGVFMWAIQRALDIARNGFVRPTADFIVHPSYDDMLTFERNYNEAHRLDFDIETPESGEIEEEDLADQEEETDEKKRDLSYTIIRASLCYAGKAISFPWQSPYREIAMRMLAKAQRLGVWNEDFDVPRLHADGARINGRVYDYMKLWKHLQPSLPTKLKCRSLEFVSPFYHWLGEPWKHLNSDQPEFYSCCDALALNQNGDGIERDLRSKGVWNLYERHVVDCYQVLTKMAANGLPYDREQAGRFEIELQTKLDERLLTLQERVPNDLKRPKQKGGYKKLPKETVGLAQRKFKVLGSDLTKDEIISLNFVPQNFEIYTITRWCILEPFNPGSPGEDGQVADLLRHYGHKLGTNRKTKKGTVDDDTLKKLQKKCKVSRKPQDQEFAALLQIVRECRQLKKILGTYVRGWRPGTDGRIHPTPGFWGRMFRISWRRPNTSATVQDKQDKKDEFEIAVAQGFRKCVAARPGHLILESDWKSMESILVAYFAGDPDYDRLARLGVHDYFTCHLLVDRKKMLPSDLPDLAWANADLKRLFKQVKADYPQDRDDGKHCCHGIAYGMTSHLMSEMYEMSKVTAQRMIDLFFVLFPKIKAWQKSVLDRASRECKLRNPFGYEMPFWEVHRWDSKKQVWALGEDAKSAIAFLPRDTGAAMLKEVLLRVRSLAEEGVLLVSNHDSLACEVREDDLYRVARVLKTEMERPVKELGNLIIPVELKAGGCWHDDSMHTLDLPDTPSSVTPLLIGDPKQATTVLAGA